MNPAASGSARYLPLPDDARRGRIGLALSGGGFRASLFHLGALQRLNEAGRLSTVTTIASVSGGSITNGVLARAWPRLQRDAAGVFAGFDEHVARPLRAFCAHDRRTGPLVWDRLNPFHWKRLLEPDGSATSFLADAYAQHLVPGLTLADLTRLRDESGIAFVFCSTNLATGVDFVFDPARCGDYRAGYVHGRALRLADAIAASSSFPIAFPPLCVRRSDFGPPHADDSPGFPDTVSLTDGGVYDNLALEPLWKDHAVVFCSDGGALFRPGSAPASWIVPRLRRSYEVVSSQALAVRKRWLIASYVKQVYAGTYWGVGTDVDDYRPSPGAAPGFRGDALDAVSRIRTDLDAFSDLEQDVLVAHGWCVANAALATHAGAALATTVPGRGAALVADPAGTVAALSER